MSLLLETIKDGYCEHALELIRANVCDPSYVDIYGDTALLWACHWGSEEVALELIRTGKSNISHIRTYKKQTALILACQNKMANVAKLIIENDKSTINHTDEFGNTAYTWAEYNGLVEVALMIQLSNMKF